MGHQLLFLTALFLRGRETWLEFRNNLSLKEIVYIDYVLHKVQTYTPNSYFVCSDTLFSNYTELQGKLGIHEHIKAYSYLQNNYNF
jgi:hypothetical protein